VALRLRLSPGLPFNFLSAGWVATGALILAKRKVLGQSVYGAMAAAVMPKRASVIFIEDSGHS
jgi:hypothetical protein